MSFDQIVKPTLILDENRAMRNIDRMIERANSAEVDFRPHFKTHQSAEIGQLFRQRGVEKITVSSVEMAEYFAKSNWKDITIAFPVNILQIKEINHLAKDVFLGLLVESIEVVDALGKNLDAPVNVWIKIDVGAGRTGISWENEIEVKNVVERVIQTPNLHLEGLLTHAGHTYQTRQRSDTISVYQNSIRRLQNIQSNLQGLDLKLKISVGDTPSCCLVDDFEGVDEIRPGNFVFFDAMQIQIGSCNEEDVAVALACPIVALHPEREECVVYGGAIHLSKEYMTELDGIKHYGYIAPLHSDRWGKIIHGAYEIGRAHV